MNVKKGIFSRSILMAVLVVLSGCQPALKADLLPLVSEQAPPLLHENSSHQEYPAPYIMPVLSVAGINLRSLKMGNTGISLNSSRPATDRVNSFRESQSSETALKSSAENSKHTDQQLIQSAT